MLIILLQIVAAIILAMLQLSFITILPTVFHFLNIIIIALVLLLLLSRPNKALLFALVVGLIFDLQTATFFGLHILALLTTTLVSYFFYEKFFTNKSIYSFISIISIATLAYELSKIILLLLIDALTNKISINLIINKFYFTSIIAELFVNILTVVIIFYGINYFSKKLKPFFIPH